MFTNKSKKQTSISRTFSSMFLSCFMIVILGGLFGAQPALAQQTIEAGCMDDLFPGNLGCTANDVRVSGVADVTGDGVVDEDDITFEPICDASASNAGADCSADPSICLDGSGTPDPELCGDKCAFPGDTTSFAATFIVELSAQERWDIGLYFGIDGDVGRKVCQNADRTKFTSQECMTDADCSGQNICAGDGALTGSCSISTLPEVGSFTRPDGTTGNFVDLDMGDPMDLCGDINSANNPIFYDLSTTSNFITTTCTDLDGDGQLNLPSCTSWRQSGANETCTSPTDAFPGTSSKCNCDPTFQVPIEIPPAELLVVKTANPTTVNEPGDTVTFSVDITNTGIDPNNDVTLNSLIDDIHGDLLDPGNTGVSNNTCLALNGTVIAPGGTVSCTFDAVVSGPGDSSETDTVIASGVDDNGNPIEGSDDATVTIIDILPTVTLVKSADPQTLPEPGGDFVFTLTITNTSVEDVTITDLTDTQSGATDFSACAALVGTVLTPGEVTSCQYTVNHSDAGSFDNTASVTVQDDEGNDASDTDDETVTVTDVLPTVTLVKDANPSTLPEPGGDFVFTLTITNTSVEDVTITDLTDTQSGATDFSACAALVGTVLTPGEVTSCQYTVNHSDAGSFDNTASVTVQDNEGNPASDSDDETVTVTDVLPTVTLVKDANPTTLPEPGGDFLFTLTITNTSVEDVTITDLTDTQSGSTDFSACAALVGTVLTPGGMTSCQYTVNHSDAGSFDNTASVTVQDNEGNPASDSDDETVTVTDVPPDASLTKTATMAVVTYEVVVTNESGVEELELTMLEDDQFGDITQVQGDIQSTTCGVPQTLQPNGQTGDTYTCSFDAKVSSSPHTDIVTGTVSDNEGGTVTPSDDATVTFE